MNKPRQVALLGGSFDPVHLGHMALAQAALAQLPVDELWWVPAGQPWQKTRVLAPAEHRLAMLGLAIGRDARQRVETCEIERGGPTYTIDTLEVLSARHPAVVWHWLMGWDQFMNLPTWHRWRDVLARVRLAVVERPAEAPASHAGQPKAPMPEALRGLQPQFLHMAPWNVSSTTIRADVALGRSVLDRVSAPVARYIADHRLYQSTGA